MFGKYKPTATECGKNILMNVLRKRLSCNIELLKELASYTMDYQRQFE